MSADAESGAPTPAERLDEAIAQVAEKARELARLGPRAKAQLLRACIGRIMEQAEDWAAKGASARSASPGEEWLAGVTPTVRLFRLLAESLDAIADTGRPPLGRTSRRRADERLTIDVFPTSPLDRVQNGGFSASLLMEAGLDEEATRQRQATFYDERDPQGGVALILGAGNVSSIPPMDVATEMFVEGRACVLKMNPVNEWVGPILERALEPLIESGYLRIVYGGAEVGEYLVYHQGIDKVHITGSDRTHDRIVWGPPGPDRERRLAATAPLLQIPITSELGNVSPVAIVPHTYDDAELRFLARNVATMVANNASFNCNAARLLITATDWRQRDAFLELVVDHLEAAPTRQAYYPGAVDRYEAFLEGRAETRRIGEAGAGRLPWALVPSLHPGDRENPLFRTESFCGILGETSVGSTDPVEFLEQATGFMNDTLWGTLNAMLVIHPRLEGDPRIADALDRSILALRYGTVSINQWPALGYAWGSTPWGGHQSSTLADIQSGIGWVHNTYMLDGIDKSVVRGPLVARPDPVWFYDHPKLERVAPAVAAMESRPSWLQLPGLLAKALL